MFEQAILGVDPGMASAGLAMVRGNGAGARVEWASAVRTPAGLGEGPRLRMLHDAVAAAVAEHGPDAVAIERLMWGRNVGSAMAVARASGVVLLLAEQRGIPVSEYAPLEVKMAVTGSGAASKAQVRRALSRLLGIADLPTDPDAADAVAVAVCHLHQSRLRTLVARA